MFRSSDSGGSWQKINNGLPALYERALAINANGDIFVGADFVSGAGGVYRSTDDGDNWVEINHGVIQSDVRALGDQFKRPYFCRNILWRGRVPLDRQWRQLDSGEQRLGLRKHLVSGNQSGWNHLRGNCRLWNGVYRSTDNGDSWTLVNTGLTSTDVAALAIDGSTIFAGTQSMMGQGGGMFRSTDNGDTWTEQNNGFTALDVNAVVINRWLHLCRYRGWCFPLYK